jgi:hypothetical protein
MSVGDVLRNNPHIKDANRIRPGDRLKMPEKSGYSPRLRSFAEIE